MRPVLEDVELSSTGVLRNALTVDVEEYFQVAAFEDTISREHWEHADSRVEYSTHRVLDLFGARGVQGTFFVLGWIAERYPGLVHRIVAEGHELASHGYDHTRIHQFTAEQFRADVVKTKAILEDIGGLQVRGYRAPSYSINSKNLWALDVLLEAGHIYSSSIYPIRHDLYGMPEAPRFPFRFRPDGILEIPVTTVALAGRNFPCGGGGYFRLLPYPVFKWALRRVNDLDQRSGLFYFHPWEVDPAQPRVQGAPLKSRFRHYLNLDSMHSRLDRLIGDFSWGRMDHIFLGTSYTSPAAAGEVGRRPGEGHVLVRPFALQDRAAWNAFVEAHPEGTFFHLAEWQYVLQRAFGHAPHYLLAESHGGEIRGVLPLAHVKSVLFGNALVSTPFCVYGGIIASDATAHAALTQAACDLARQLDVDYLEMRNRQRQHPQWPCKDLYVTFRKPIDPDSEKNMLAIPRKQRAMVRKGIKEDLRVEIDDSVDRHYHIYTESLRNLGTPSFSRNYLRLLKEVFGGNCEIVSICKGDQVVASVLNFYFRDEVLPYYGGGTFEARSVAGNDFMYWSVMERARARGCRIFDYGRSKRGTGAYDFKTYWGFEPEQLYYEYFLVKRKEMPNLSPTNPKYGLAIQVWRRLPLKLTQVIGPPIAKYLG